MGVQKKIQKPGIAEWTLGAEAFAERLTECVHVYKRNVDVFMAEAERQDKSDLAIKILQRLHALLDRADMPEEIGSNPQKRDEQIIDGFKSVFQESLRALPWISLDMQKLLKSSWMKNFPSKIAESLFIANGEEDKGLGSGLPEHGRLPAVLSDLVEREEVGETRPSHEESLLAGEPQRHDVEASERWAQQNSGYLRTAGKIE
ncbi:MAG: hypothetical protein WC521_05770 [Bdellovibrionales bacterium]